MISGARYQRVATYSVKNPVWSCLGSATRANPKSHIYKYFFFKLPDKSYFLLIFVLKLPLNHMMYSVANYSALSHDAIHSPNECILIHVEFGIQNNKYDHYLISK